ncbi:MAG: hypothetical protein HFE39_05090 [Clostridiales bacterium]|jgi:hypothetical protein|nr:hypothetical protein [Clostridiales bacterium]
MGVNGKLSVGILGVSLLLLLAAITLCMLELVSAASTVGMVVSALCVPGLYIAFQSWEEEDDQDEDFPPIFPVNDNPMGKNLCMGDEQN